MLKKIKYQRKNIFFKNENKKFKLANGIVSTIFFSLIKRYNFNIDNDSDILLT